MRALPASWLGPEARYMPREAVFAPVSDLFSQPRPLCLRCSDLAFLPVSISLEWVHRPLCLLYLRKPSQPYNPTLYLTQSTKLSSHFLEFGSRGLEITKKAFGSRCKAAA